MENNLIVIYLNCYNIKQLSMFIKRQWVLILPLFAIIMSGCPFPPTDDAEPVTEYTPLFMSREQLEVSVKTQSVRQLNKPGKMILYQNYIFLNEMYEGIHVIDNSDPLSPQKITFISVPGCIDMTIRSNKLIVDNAVDLVVLNIENIQDVVEMSRKKDIFPEMTPPDFGSIPDKYSKKNRAEGLIIVGWEK